MACGKWHVECSMVPVVFFGIEYMNLHLEWMMQMQMHGQVLLCHAGKAGD